LLCGNDRLNGGTGDEKFVFADGGHKDTIYDFVAGVQS
jgi:Ca2+-binding RTX toxin-like protein